MLKALWRQSPPLLLVAVSAAIACALLMIYLLREVSASLSHPHPTLQAFVLFVAAGVVAAGCQWISAVTMTHLSNRVVSGLREALVARIPDAGFAQVETLGVTRLQGSLVEDAVRLADALPNAVNLLRDGVFAAAGFAYMTWLSPKMTALLAATVIVGLVIFQVVNTLGLKAQQSLRDRGDRLLGLFSDLTGGLKQIKIDRRLEETVRGQIRGETRDLQRLNTVSMSYLSAANCLIVAVFIAAIGVLNFSGSLDAGSTGLRAAFMVVMLLLLGPAQGIASTVQSLGRGGTSLKRIHTLIEALTAAAEPRGPAEPALPPAARTELLLEDVAHAYSNDERQQFALAPIHGRVLGGEALFITGGNGSGKTTLLKVLSGLYAPAAGQLRFNGTAITDANRAAYRERLAVVFSENCLFEGLSATEADITAAAFQPDLERLGLGGVIDPARGLFAQAKSCSSGERKRIAYLLAPKDNRDIYLFDEFAADQDPAAKAMFYEMILPELKAAGKIVVVVTHDDRYFAAADHELTLERGLPAAFKSRLGLRDGPPVKAMPPHAHCLMAGERP